MKYEDYNPLLKHECPNCGAVIRSHCHEESCQGCRIKMKAKLSEGQSDPRD